MRGVWAAFIFSSETLQTQRAPNTKTKACNAMRCFRLINHWYPIHPSFCNLTNAVPAPVPISRFKKRAQRYSLIKSLWNLTMLPTHSVPGARKVVRKCRVPSFWPKPEPGTTHTPVASSRRMQ